jgi:hypothetical protein
MSPFGHTDRGEDCDPNDAAGMRERLLSVTEMIETSALVGQSPAIRHNTAVLRQTTTPAIVLLTLCLARNVVGWRELIDPLLSIFQ